MSCVLAELGLGFGLGVADPLVLEFVADAVFLLVASATFDSAAACLITATASKTLLTKPNTNFVPVKYRRVF